MRGVIFLAWGPAMIVGFLIPPGRFLSESSDAAPPGHVATAGAGTAKASLSPQGILQQTTITSKSSDTVVTLSIALLVILVVVILTATVLWSTPGSTSSYKSFTDAENEADPKSNPEVCSNCTGSESVIVKVHQAEEENLSEELAERAWCAQEIAKMNISKEMWEAMQGFSKQPFSPISSSSSEGSIFEDTSRTVSPEKLPFCLLMGDDPRWEDPRPKPPATGPHDPPSERSPPDCADLEKEPKHSVSKKLRHPLQKREKQQKKSKSKASRSSLPSQTR